MFWYTRDFGSKNIFRSKIDFGPKIIVGLKKEIGAPKLFGLSMKRVY